MATTIIGKRYNSLFQTNIKSSEKFNCQAMKDYNRKKEQERQRLSYEINRRTAIDELLY